MWLCVCVWLSVAVVNVVVVSGSLNFYSFIPLFKVKDIGHILIYVLVKYILTL